MAKPRLIIADADVGYIIPLQVKFVEMFLEKINLEIITDRQYFDVLFSTHQEIDVLIVSDDFYSPMLHRHNISHIFLLQENVGESCCTDPNTDCIYKYASVKEIANEIVGKSDDVFGCLQKGNQQSQVITFYSAAGGTGKTTLAMGVCASLAKKYKRVLYLNASELQVFQHMLEDQTPILAPEVYAHLAQPANLNYASIRSVIRKEMFCYLPPFKAALMSIGLRYSFFTDFITSAKASGEYDIIIVDANTTFDEEKATLLGISDKVFVITKQTVPSVLATNILTSNIHGLNEEKYIFICNDFNRSAQNALAQSNISLRFAVGDYVEHITNCENKTPLQLSEEDGIQRIALSIM